MPHFGPFNDPTTGAPSIKIPYSTPASPVPVSLKFLQLLKTIPDPTGSGVAPSARVLRMIACPPQFLNMNLWDEFSEIKFLNSNVILCDEVFTPAGMHMTDPAGRFKTALSTTNSVAPTV